jgi:hypothetical protein
MEIADRDGEGFLKALSPSISGSAYSEGVLRLGGSTTDALLRITCIPIPKVDIGSYRIPGPKPKRVSKGLEQYRCTKNLNSKYQV